MYDADQLVLVLLALSYPTADSLWTDAGHSHQPPSQPE